MDLDLYLSSSNTFYNNYLNNIVNVFNETTDILTNTYNTAQTCGLNIVGGPYIGGNYWAYPNGTGFSQICTDSDANGFCDSVYNLDGANSDTLPLKFTSTVVNCNPSNSGGAGSSSTGGSAASGNGGTSNSLIQSFSTNAGIPVTITISAASIDLTQLIITTNQTVSNAIVSVSPISISNVQLPTTGQSYQTFQITTSGVNDTVISNVAINFKVNTSWISDNNLDPANVTLYRNNNGTWIPLPTSLSSQNSQYYFFNAASPGFSNYTILAQQIECDSGATRCLLNDSQICSSNVWILSQHCQLGCNAGICITTTNEAVTFFQNILNNIEGFFNSLPGTLQLDIGNVTYFILLLIIISGVVIVSTILIRTSRKKIWKRK